MPDNVEYGDNPGDLLADGLPQSLKGRKGFANFLHGDADGIKGRLKGGNDTLKGASQDEIGDGDNVLYGDAFRLEESAKGGKDRLKGGENTLNYLHGDGAFLTDASRGGNDRLKGADNAGNTLFGDAFEMRGDSVGGNDKLLGGTGVFGFGDGMAFQASNYLHGDADILLERARGGDDQLTGGIDALNVMYGDAYTVQSEAGFAGCGDDTLTGGAGSEARNYLHGDGGFLRSGRGGNDLLIGGEGAAENIMYGDAYGVDAFFDVAVVCGDDVLVSGRFANDFMWGDAVQIAGDNVVFGRDTFVFGPDNGNDTIGDFRQGEDLIDLSALATGFGGFDLEVIGNDTLIDFNDGNTILVLNNTALAETDFIF
jgi:hypothetical protein